MGKQIVYTYFQFWQPYKHIEIQNIDICCLLVGEMEYKSFKSNSNWSYQAVLTFIIQKSNFHCQIILFKAPIIYPLWQFTFDSPHWYIHVLTLFELPTRSKQWMWFNMQLNILSFALEPHMEITAYSFTLSKEKPFVSFAFDGKIWVAFLLEK